MRRQLKFKVLDAVGASNTFPKVLADIAEVTIKRIRGIEFENEVKSGKYDAVIISTWHKMQRDIIMNSNLKVIGTASVGFDHIDTKAAQEKGVKVVTAAGASSYSVAEHTIGLMICIARRIYENLLFVKDGAWSSFLTIGTELYGKTLGIIGMGRIGTHVANIARALGMKILIYDPYVSIENIEKVGAEKVNLEYLLRNSDFISIHAPLTSETRKMIGRHEIENIKDKAYIINTARGEIVDEHAILDALRNGKISGYAADVLTTEPPTDETSPLLKAYKSGEKLNLIITSHIAGVTLEALNRYALYILENVKKALTEVQP
ncbi:MAG: hydroxyacid dehydrogenase [Candidatus Bathyarchaeia archaeon]